MQSLICILVAVDCDDGAGGDDNLKVATAESLGSSPLQQLFVVPICIWRAVVEPFANIFLELYAKSGR